MITNSPSDAVFKALADGTRREILTLLAVRPEPVNRLASRFEITRPAISRHLKLLKDAELIELTTTGRENVYRLKTAALRQLESWLRTFWGKRLASLKALAEETAP